MKETSQNNQAGATLAPSLQTLSETLSRAMLAAKMGYQYDGDRDLYQALGYKTDLIFSDYAARYHRQDIARAIIDRPIQHTWRGPVELVESGDDEETEFEKAWKELDKKLHLKQMFIRLDKLSSIGKYGVLLLGFSDVKEPPTWRKPVSGTPQLLYVKPLAEQHALIKQFETNTKDSRYGRPQIYQISIQGPSSEIITTEVTQMELEAHYTRVIHVVPNPLESDIEGEPILKPVFNRLMDLEKLVGGSAEMFWRGARPGYQGVIGDDYQLTSAEEDDLQDQINEFEHNLRRLLVNKGIKWEALQPQVSDPSKHVDMQIQMISAETGIPKRILTGSERGELSSEQDITSWNSIIQARREEHAESNIIRPFVDHLIMLKILPEPSTGDYSVRWEDLQAASDKDQADVGKIRAESLAAYVRNPDADMIIPPEAFMQFMLGLSDDEIEQVAEMASAYIEERMKEMEEEDALRQEIEGEVRAEVGAPQPETTPSAQQQ